MSSWQPSTNALNLPESCFDRHPGRRLTAARAHVDSLAGEHRTELDSKICEFTFPHCAYAIPAWGLVVLPGPGGASKGDPADARADWTPGIAEASKHFAEFPDYLNAADRKHYCEQNHGLKMWENLRQHINAVALDGVAADDRIACWGLVNLTTEHAPSEASRGRTGATHWNIEPLHRIIGICRPALVIAPPSRKGGACCHARLEKLLQRNGAQPEKLEPTQYEADSGPRKCRFRWWKVPWGRCRVGRMYTHPSYWSRRVREILSEEAKIIAAVG